MKKIMILLTVILINACSIMQGPYDYQDLPSNADLAGLSMENSPELEQIFNSSKTSYNLTVATDVSIARLIPVLSDPLASVSVNGFAVPNKTQSQMIGLVEGIPNSISIVVTAQDGKTMKQYILTIIRGSASGDSLSEARLNDISTDPDTVRSQFSFNSDIYTYDSIILKNTTSQFYLYPIKKNIQATTIIKCNGNTTTNNKIILNVGANVVSVEVTALDGVTKKTYTLNIYRQSNVSTLSSLSAKIENNAVPLVYALANHYNGTYMVIPPDTGFDSVLIYLALSNPNASCTINGVPFNKTLGYMDVGGVTIATSKEVKIIVTSEDGLSSTEYTVTISLQTAGSA